MDRTKAAGYITVDGKRVYQDRDKPNGIAGTALIAADRTAVQEELMNLITGAGLTPDADDLTQVFKAINKIMSGSEEGYFLKSGDTAAWVTSDGWIIAGNARVMSGGSGAGGAIQVGDYVWSDGITACGYGKMAVSLSVADVNGKGGDYRVGALLQFTAFDGTQENFYFRGDGYIYDQNGNKFLKAADLDGVVANTNPGITGAISGTSICVNPEDGRAYFAYSGNTQIAALAWNADVQAETQARVNAVISEANAREEADASLQNQINNCALKSELPLPEGMHCQVFSAPIPSPCPEEGWLVDIPSGWKTHSFVTACDTGANVYAVSAVVENNTQARLWAKYPTNGAWAQGGEVTVTSFGYPS